MLLSKPKKSYKSVSKTELLPGQKEQMVEDQVDIFDYEEMNITQDSVQYIPCFSPAWYFY